jgi:hypothetical protein
VCGLLGGYNGLLSILNENGLFPQILQYAYLGGNDIKLFFNFAVKSSDCTLFLFLG